MNSYEYISYEVKLQIERKKIKKLNFKINKLKQKKTVK
jgi:hypothetical protein